MSFNKYNTRNTSRFNTPGQFVREGEVSAGPQGTYSSNMDSQQASPPVQYNKPTINTSPGPPLPPLPPPPAPPPCAGSFPAPTPPPPILAPSTPAPPTPAPSTPAPSTPAPLTPATSTPAPRPADAVKLTELAADGDQQSRPPWMKARLVGVKKISNKERRRRQNENLRRLLSPKSALMVLNEIMPGVQLASQFKVEAVGNPSGNQYYNVTANSYCADLTLQGTTYKGYGDNKLTARNAAAEQAVRDLILRRMARALLADAQADGLDAGAEAETETEETLPMIQLASFALHKLFAEWEYEGHRVPQLRASAGSVSELEAEAPPARSKPGKALPAQAAAMHPCMLLTYMRPHVEYRELGATGDRPQNMQFTVGIEVDGTTYIGKACNKKEARKAAARAACISLFDVKYDEGPH